VRFLDSIRPRPTTPRFWRTWRCPSCLRLFMSRPCLLPSRVLREKPLCSGGTRHAFLFLCSTHAGDVEGTAANWNDCFPLHLPVPQPRL
jgi:hypothetical protein